MMIDQINLSILLTILNITKIISLYNLGSCVCHFVLLCCCCSPVVQQGCYPFEHSFVVKAT